MSILTYIIGWPLAAALLLCFVPRSYKFVMRLVAVAATFISMLLAVKMFWQFDAAPADAHGFKFVQQLAWWGAHFGGINFHYFVGVDGLNVGLVLMGAIVAFAAALCVVGNPRARKGVLHPAAGDDRRHPGRVCVAGPVFLLFLPRTRAGADVHHDRRLGPGRKQELRHVPNHAVPEHRRADFAGRADCALRASPARTPSTSSNSPNTCAQHPLPLARPELHLSAAAVRLRHSDFALAVSHLGAAGLRFRAHAHGHAARRRAEEIRPVRA